MGPICFKTTKCQKLSTVVGACVLMLSIGYNWYWSNLQVYVLSYYVKHNPDASQDVETPWVMTLCIGISVIGLYASDVCSKKIGKRLTTVLGIGVYEAGLLCAYCTLRTSIVGITVAFGVLMAVGVYMSNGMALKYVTEWSTNEIGIHTSLVHMSVPAGAIVMNLVLTYIVNPDNLKPDITVGNFKLFSQDELLNRVSSFLIMMGLVALVMGVISILMMRDAEQQQDVRPESVVKTERRMDGGGGVSTTCTQQTSTYKSVDCGEDPQAAPQAATTAVPNDNSHSSNSNNNSSNNGVQMVLHTTTQAKDTAATVDLSPRQVIRNSTLHCAWFLAIVGDVTIVIVANYYKVYGLTRIVDDHFVTDLYTPFLATTALLRPCWGVVLDRFGVKITYIAYFACCALTSLGFYFSLLISPWCYAVVSSLFGGVGSCSYLIASFFSIKAFGKTHFLANYALLLAPCFFSNVGLSPLLNHLSAHLGWFYLFLFCSCLNALALIVTIVRLPNL